MWGRKNKKKAAIEAAVDNMPQLKKEAEAKIEEYKSSIAIGKASIENELKAFEIAAQNLKLSGKRVVKIKKAFSAKVPKRTLKKHGDKLDVYNESIEEYIRIVSHINWLLNTVSTCYEAVASLNEDVEKYAQARNIRIEAQKYFADVNYKKAKIEKITDGIVMPVSTYVR